MYFILLLSIISKYKWVQLFLSDFLLELHIYLLVCWVWDSNLFFFFFSSRTHGVTELLYVWKCLLLSLYLNNTLAKYKNICSHFFLPENSVHITDMFSLIGYWMLVWREAWVFVLFYLLLILFWGVCVCARVHVRVRVSPLYLKNSLCLDIQ